MRKIILTAAIIIFAGMSLLLAASFRPASGDVSVRYEVDMTESRVLEIRNTDLPEPIPIRQADLIDPEKPMLALTFDDGPSVHTEHILDILEEYNARATFCVVGMYIEQGRETVQRTARQGCQIIGHSWAHDNLTKLSADELRLDILRTSDKLEEVTGVRSMMFRPPYGDVNEGVRSVARELGFSIMTWCVDPIDWEESRTDEDIYNAIMDEATDRVIILSHDRVAATAQAMERVIPDLIAQGYQLVTISELMDYSDIAVEAGAVYRSAR